MSSTSPQDSNLAVVIARAIRVTRIRSGWSERELARRLGTNQGAVQRLESGRQRHMDTVLATAALSLLGVRFTVDADPPGLASRAGRDVVHSRCCGYIGRHLTRYGWNVRAEVEIGTGRYRGWIDLLAYRPSDRALLCIEVKTQIDDLGRILRTLGWYARSSRDAAHALGWRPRIVVPVLLALATTETDARLTADADLRRLELPGGAVALAGWIDGSNPTVPGPSVALIDPRSRRREWLTRTRSDGGRAPAPYHGYRDAAVALAADPRSRLNR